MRSRDLSSRKASLDKFYAPRYRMPIRTNSKANCQGPWKNYGAYFGRVGHAYYPIELLLREAVTVTEEQEWKIFEKNRQYMASQVLLAMTRDLEREIKAVGADICKIVQMMEYGRNKARSKDARDLKQKILEWITPGQPLTNADKKPDRGFNHQQIGVLLCPVNLSWSDFETRAQLRCGTLNVLDCQWPSFLYPEGHFNWSNQWHGFLKSDILLKAYEYIFFQTPLWASGKSQSSVQSVFDMKHVSAVSIAYVAAQVYFALSSSSSFGAWKGYVKELYDRLLDRLEDPRCEHEAEELVCWWNQRLFHEEPRLWQQQRREKAQEKKAREEGDIQDAFDAAFAAFADFISAGGNPEEGSEMDQSADDSSVDSAIQLEDLIHVEYCSDSALTI